MPYRWVNRTLIIGTTVICLAGLPLFSMALEAQPPPEKMSADKSLAELKRRAAVIWGSDNVWVPDAKTWVQYEPDLGERSAVDFENGVARVQVLLKATDDPQGEQVLTHMEQGIGNLILREAEDPLEMIKTQGSKSSGNRETRVYLVRRGDSLWKIAQRFDMTTKTLSTLNELSRDTVLPVGLPLKVMVYTSHDLTLASSPQPRANAPLLLDQIRMADGSPVPQWLVRDFAMEVVSNQTQTQKVLGEDGIERLAVSVEFKLVSNHLEVRARKFQPLVQTYARKHALDPALIMAIIHTESMFNPRARSSTPAYGLMQLVPHSGGREAYQVIYGQNRKLTSQYLYDPKNNIELGAAYFDILVNRYMKSILDPISRSYCAVAAYNTGSANVGRAFVSKKSINQAIPVINSMEAPQVYSRLIEKLPFRESRKYVRKVIDRARLYEHWE
jgi:peptidoglycan lytic transglycosylase C